MQHNIVNNVYIYFPVYWFSDNSIVSIHNTINSAVPLPYGESYNSSPQSMTKVLQKELLTIMTDKTRHYYLIELGMSLQVGFGQC